MHLSKNHVGERRQPESTYPSDDLNVIRLDCHLENVIHSSGQIELAGPVDISSISIFVLDRTQAHHVTMVVVGLRRGNDLYVWSDVPCEVPTVAKAGRRYGPGSLPAKDPVGDIAPVVPDANLSRVPYGGTQVSNVAESYHHASELP